MKLGRHDLDVAAGLVDIEGGVEAVDSLTSELDLLIVFLLSSDDRDVLECW
jgi:hypothetical protein